MDCLLQMASSLISLLPLVYPYHYILLHFEISYHVQILIYSFLPGASIQAAFACNRHILALESDSKLFSEVLQPLALPPLKPMVSTFAAAVDLSDDDNVVPDAPLHDICE